LYLNINLVFNDGEVAQIMSEASGQALIAVLQRSVLFAGLATDDLKKLAEDADQASWEAGNILFHQGDPADRFFLLLEGRVGLYLDRVEEMACLARIVRPGETFAEACICGQRVFPVTAKILRQSSLVAIPRASLLSLIEQRPHFLLTMLSEMSIRLRGLIRQITDLKMKTTAQRLATYLLTLVDREIGPADIHLPYEKKLLAHELGMQPETLSRALMKLQCLGVHYSRSGNILHIADVATLQQFCPSIEEDQ
jgi:CRP/FNR family transcriptional activator FtrB